MNNDKPITVENAEAKPGPALVTDPAPVVRSLFDGKPLRLINPQQPLRSGEFVANVHGQFLWELVGFSHEGVRVQDQIHGGVSDYRWENFYRRFYVRGDEPNNPTTPS